MAWAWELYLRSHKINSSPKREQQIIPENVSIFEMLKRNKIL
jgi:hypothetical protein